MRISAFSPRSGENAHNFKMVGRFLIPPFGGSNPPVAGALAEATFYPLHDRLKPSNAILNPYKASDGGGERVWIRRGFNEERLALVQ
jgi:hypothetical protein